MNVYAQKAFCLKEPYYLWIEGLGFFALLTILFRTSNNHHLALLLYSKRKQGRGRRAGDILPVAIKIAVMTCAMKLLRLRLIQDIAIQMGTLSAERFDFTGFCPDHNPRQIAVLKIHRRIERNFFNVCEGRGNCLWQRQLLLIIKKPHHRVGNKSR